MLKLRIFEAQPEFLYSYKKKSVYDLLYARLKYIEEIGKIWKNFASINFRELINIEFFAYFTFANWAKIREIRESFYTRKFLILKYFDSLHSGSSLPFTVLDRSFLVGIQKKQSPAGLFQFIIHSKGNFLELKFESIITRSHPHMPE